MTAEPPRDQLLYRHAYDHADRLVGDDGFYQAGDDEGLLYQQDGEPGDYAYAASATDADADDNGLSDYPDFPVHSSSQHGADTDTDTTYGSHTDVYHTDEDHGYEESPVTPFASETSYQARPYDDSRRLPSSTSFTSTKEEKAKPAPKRQVILPAIVAFAKTETGKVIVAQAAAIAMAFVTKKVKDILPSNAAETGKNVDLAASPAFGGVPPATWPATTAAQDVSAAAHHDDTISSSREPLA